MKKYIFCLLCLITFPALAHNSNLPTTISKDDACNMYSSHHEESLEVQGFTNTTIVNTFVKKGSNLYYVTQEQRNKEGSPFDKNYSVYTYSCTSKKATLLIDSTVFQKTVNVMKNKTNGQLFTDMRIESVKGKIITTELHADGIGCQESDNNYCDFGIVLTTIDMDKKIGKIKHIYQFSLDKILGVFRY